LPFTSSSLLSLSSRSSKGQMHSHAQNRLPVSMHSTPAAIVARKASTPPAELAGRASTPRKLAVIQSPLQLSFRHRLFRESLHLRHNNVPRTRAASTPFTHAAPAATVGSTSRARHVGKVGIPKIAAVYRRTHSQPVVRPATESHPIQSCKFSRLLDAHNAP
jgi:hypothetical protein